jgi:hypothetical protein
MRAGFRMQEQRSVVDPLYSRIPLARESILGGKTPRLRGDASSRYLEASAHWAPAAASLFGGGSGVAGVLSLSAYLA